MTGSAPTISVVIPTLGRPSLAEAIASVRRQAVHAEILVVNDSGEPLDPALVSGPDVVVLNTAGRTGAAAARNTGMAASTGRFIAFLDDDDVWLSGHLARAQQVLDEGRYDIYASRALVVNEHGEGRVEPVELVGDRSATEYYLGRSMWRARNRRILTPTLVFDRRLAEHPMDPTLHHQEDLWWLYTAERDFGARVYQSPHIGVVVEAVSARLAQRSATTDEADWLDRLESLEPGLSSGYLVGTIGRLAAREGAPRQVWDVARHVASHPHPLRWVAPLAVEGAVASVVAARNSMRARRNNRRS